jgi:AcrR family transcriptional regulator
MMVTKRWGGQTADERRSERRSRLIEAGIRLYGSQGFHNTGVRAICEQASLTERYFYENFANSEDLLSAVFSKVVANMLAQIQGADDPSLSLIERTRLMLETYYAALRSRPRSARVFLVEIVGISTTIDALFDQSLISISEPIFTIFDPDQTGPLALQPLLRRGVSGGLLHIALAWGSTGYADPLDDVVAAAMRLVQLANPAIT